MRGPADTPGLTSHTVRLLVLRTSTRAADHTHVARDFRPAEFLIELYECYLWRLRSLWSDEPSRQLASVILRDAIVKHGMSEHDAHILVRTVAEAMYAGEGNVRTSRFFGMSYCRLYADPAEARVQDV